MVLSFARINSPNEEPYHLLCKSCWAEVIEIAKTGELERKVSFACGGETHVKWVKDFHNFNRPVWRENRMIRSICGHENH